MSTSRALASISQMVSAGSNREAIYFTASQTTTGGLELRFLRLGTVSVMVFLVINTGAISIAQDGAGRWVVDAKFGRALPSRPVLRRLGASAAAAAIVSALCHTRRFITGPPDSPPALRPCYCSTNPGANASRYLCADLDHTHLFY